MDTSQAIESRYCLRVTKIDVGSIWENAFQLSDLPIQKCYELFRKLCVLCHWNIKTQDDDHLHEKGLLSLEKDVLGEFQGPFLPQNSRILKKFKDILLI